MNDVCKPFWTAWWAVDGLGWVTFQRLLRAQRQLQLSWSQLWQLSQQTTTNIGLSAAQSQAIQDFAQQYSPASYLEYLAEKKIQVITIKDSDYSEWLVQIPDPPPVLFVQGKPELLNQPMIGVVGTRHITQYGQTVTQKITQELVSDGWTVVSGFMYGVDVVAHQTVSAAGGQTVGVLGFGFDHIFPRSQVPLLAKLVAEGQCFITEYAPHVRGKAGLFPRRNRLIAGLSQGVVVTEAAVDSGSLITAELAAEYGRSVYAVPGPITTPFSEGTRALLNLGALCINSGHQVTDDQQLQGHRVSLVSQLSPVAQQLLGLMQRGRQSTSELQNQTALPVSQLLTELTNLEIQGKITRVGEQWQVIK